MQSHTAEVREQLRRILNSPLFSSSARSSQFLAYCVEQTLLGKQKEIKESTIAVEVFGRAPDYNPRIDPIVRVHAKRLRDKLEHYYLSEGLHDRIRITIPKGSYIPQLERTLPRLKTTFTDWPIAPEETTSTDAPEHFCSLYSRRFWSIGLFGAVFAALTAFFFLLPMSSQALNPSRRNPDSLLKGKNNQNATQPNLVWSPNSKMLAFSWDKSKTGRPEIYLQKMQSTQPYRLTHENQPELYPAWSPDGSRIVFLRSMGRHHYEVVVTTLNGGKSDVLGPLGLKSEDQMNIQWSPHGRVLLLAEQTRSGLVKHLSLLNIETRKLSELTLPAFVGKQMSKAIFSSSGASIAFWQQKQGKFWVVSAGEIHP